MNMVISGVSDNVVKMNASTTTDACSHIVTSLISLACSVAIVTM